MKKILSLDLSRSVLYGTFITKVKNPLKKTVVSP